MRAFLALAVLVVCVLVIGTVTVVSSQWLDPGDKGDTSTDLMTPTLSTANARVFDVSPEESQVDFVTHVYGLALSGVFPVTEGTITLEPEGDALRVLVRLNIHVDAVDTGNGQVDDVLRGVMETGDYPLAFYVASSRALVPVTGEVIEFDLDGDLQVHNVAQPYSMHVTAQLISGDMWAVAVSDLDLANHEVEMPSFVGSTTIELTARLQAYEAESSGTSDTSAAE
jgi:polyisoprenoid-binding protein YceI